MSRPSCPECRAEGKIGKLLAVFGDNPAGRCDEHHAAVELRKTCCTDCLAEGREPKKCRPVSDKYPGRRCATHGRARKKRTSASGRDYRVKRNFGISGETYQALYETQGGVCAICNYATGKVKRLAVDHDHARARDVCGHDPDKGCPNCIRGLLCGPCNQTIGRLGIESLIRAVKYLTDPPATVPLFWLEPEVVEIPGPELAAEISDEVLDDPSSFWQYTGEPA